MSGTRKTLFFLAAATWRVSPARLSLSVYSLSRPLLLSSISFLPLCLTSNPISCKTPVSGVLSRESVSQAWSWQCLLLVYLKLLPPSAILSPALSSPPFCCIFSLLSIPISPPVRLSNSSRLASLHASFSLFYLFYLLSLLSLLSFLFLLRISPLSFCVSFLAISLCFSGLAIPLGSACRALHAYLLPSLSAT